MNTKDKIIYESLKLFSVNGYDSVSTRMIASASGVSDSAMYKHFSSKKEIFNTIIEKCKARFLGEVKKADITKIHWDEVEDICMNMFKFQTHDEWIVMFRKLLVIEQFKNPELGKLYKDFFIDMPVNGQAKLFQILIDAGYMINCNARVLSMELYAPFFMYHTVKSDSKKLLSELREHIKYFRKNYRTPLCDDVPVGI